MGKHRRQITEKELRIAAKECDLQYGVIDYLIQWVRKNQAESNNEEHDKQLIIADVSNNKVAVCDCRRKNERRPPTRYVCCDICSQGI
jgi:hypothetical protein